MTTRYALTLKSANAKTGPIPTSVSAESTCATSCPLKKNGCYAEGGPLALHWRKVSEGARGTDWAEFCGAVAKLPAGQLWRHNVAGDLPGTGDAIDAPQLAQLVRANAGRRGFTYTHKPMTARNLAAVRKASAAGFAINLSANNLAHADALSAHGLPVVVVVPSDTAANVRTPAGRPVVICPAVTHDNVTCASCGLCARSDRKVVVGFPAHGASYRRAESVVNFFRKAAQ